MIRRILGFLPVGFWLFMMFLTGINISNPDNSWSFAYIPMNVWVLSGLSVLSGILLCFDGMIPIGLMLGLIPSGYLLIGIFQSGMSGAVVVPAMLTLFYVIYAVCYYTYNHELDKP